MLAWPISLLVGLVASVSLGWSNWRRLKVEIPTLGWCIFLSGSPISTTTTTTTTTPATTTTTTTPTTTTPPPPPPKFFHGKRFWKVTEGQEEAGLSSKHHFFRGELLNFGVYWLEGPILGLEWLWKGAFLFAFGCKREYFSGTVRWELVIICCFFSSW